MTQYRLAIPGIIAVVSMTAAAHAVGSAELYTSQSYQYGRFEARIQFAAGDGVVSSFFLWKNGSEVAGTFWNELDFEKVGADCHLETNALYGTPVTNTSRRESLSSSPCDQFHTYTYEWTPDYIAWLVDGVEIRRDSGAAALAFSQNATAGMQIRFNIWPGDASFGGNFSPSILPVHQYINWVQYSSYANGAFQLEWREDFTASSIPSGWLTGNWGSPKNLSTHNSGNVGLIAGYAVLSLTADDAIGPAGAAPADTEGASGGTTGSGGATSETVAGSGTSGGTHQGTGGSNATPTTGTASSDGGCSLAAPRPSRTSSAAALLWLVAGAAMGRRRRIRAAR
jgi:endo-1,3-1,4-beta-glycanase ExoK